MSATEKARQRVESARKWLADARHEARMSPNPYNDATARQALEDYERARDQYTAARASAGLPTQPIGRSTP